MRGRQQHEFSRMDVRSCRPGGTRRLPFSVRIIFLCGLLFSSFCLSYAQSPDNSDASRPPPPPPPPQIPIQDGGHQDRPVASPSLLSPPPEASQPPLPPATASATTRGGGMTSEAKVGLGLLSVAGLLQVAVFFFLMARRRQLLRDLNDPADWSPAREL